MISKKGKNDFDLGGVPLAKAAARFVRDVVIGILIVAALMLGIVVFTPEARAEGHSGFAVTSIQNSYHFKREGQLEKHGGIGAEYTFSEPVGWLPSRVAFGAYQNSFRKDTEYLSAAWYASRLFGSGDLSNRVSLEVGHVTGYPDYSASYAIGIDVTDYGRLLLNHKAVAVVFRLPLGGK